MYPLLWPSTVHASIDSGYSSYAAVDRLFASASLTCAHNVFIAIGYAPRAGLVPDAQKTQEQLTRERERAVEEERARSDQLEEQRSVAELQNELLTEMVAAEQVTRI